MSIQTPEQIAQDVYWGISDFQTEPKGADLRALMVAAIEADRAQPRYLLISEHDDAGVIGMYYSREEAVEAATANCDDDPDIWDEYYSIQEV